MLLACASESDPSASTADTEGRDGVVQAAATSTAAADTAWTPPQPRSVHERQRERTRMVEVVLGKSPMVTDGAVIRAMMDAPRHVFVHEQTRRIAYDDTPLPIGLGQTISQPYIVAYMTELLEIDPASKVLEIGTGSGYQAAVLAHITPHVYTMEIIEPLLDRARGLLAEEGYDTVQTRHGDGYYGWPEAGPYDAIIVTCAAGHLPPLLWSQLKPGGRIVIPIGEMTGVQRLVVVRKTADGERSSRTVMPVRFVPMTGRVEQ
ncbi:MAG: protein-L-isoaspartate(D-aspartate) O-methyltransferase [Gemmatimonadetes bacterium]|nr:protein-L-isoaspartate(D-aspartate) O-methyltransferase [Gemmatimonadota bacterium]